MNHRVEKKVKRPEINKAYRIYGKVEGMKRMMPLAGSRFVVELVLADIYEILNERDRVALEQEMYYLQTQGQFELREVTGYFKRKLQAKKGY